MPLEERGILFDRFTSVWTIRFYHAILTFMKIVLLLAAIYALIINQSLKQKEKRSISVQGKMQSRSKAQNIKPGNNIYFNASFLPDLTIKPIQTRKINTEKKNFPVKSYPSYPFQEKNDKEVNENTPPDILYPPENYFSTALVPKDDPR